MTNEERLILMFASECANIMLNNPDSLAKKQELVLAAYKKYVRKLAEAQTKTEIDKKFVVEMATKCSSGDLKNNIQTIAEFMEIEI